MARRGFNALRAALGAVTGVAEGLQQREFLAEKRKREQDALDYQRQRDALSDARNLQADERQAVAASMMDATRFAGMTMPGATPLPSMQPTLRQKIGGKEYVYSPEIARAEKHRESVMARSLTNADQKAEQSAKDKRINDLTMAARKKGRNSPEAALLASESKAAYDAIFPQVERARDNSLTPFQRQELKEREDRAEAIFNTEGLDPAQAKAMSSTYKALRKAYGASKSPRELMVMAVEGGMKAQPTPKPGAGGGDYAALFAQAGGKKGKPAAQASADDPSKMTDQQLWDRVAAQSGVEYATKTYGPRP
jgi:hypothetical protein